MGGHIDDDDYKEAGLPDRRETPNVSKRELVDQYLANGWDITSRNPLTLERGRLKKVFRGKILIDG